MSKIDIMAHGTHIATIRIMIHVDDLRVSRFDRDGVSFEIALLCHTEFSKINDSCMSFYSATRNAICTAITSTERILLA